MNAPFQWNPDDLAFVLAIANVTAGFLAYHFISSSSWLRSFFPDRSETGRGQKNLIFSQRITGFFFLGVFPLLTTSLLLPGELAGYGLSLCQFDKALLWTVAFAALILPVNYFNASSPDNLAMYPQIREKEWPVSLLVQNAMSWALYLFAYELLFRGLFLFPVVAELGTVPAIVLNTSVYSLAHLPKGIKETLGAIPLGILLCIVTLWLGSIWTAFLVHLVLALSNDWFSLQAHHKNLKMKELI